MNEFHASNHFDQHGRVPNRGNQRWLVAAAAAVAAASIVGVTAIALSGGSGPADAAPAALPTESVIETATITEPATSADAPTVTAAEPTVADTETEQGHAEPVTTTPAPATTQAPAAASDAAPAEPVGPCPTYTTDEEFPVGLCAKGETVRKIQQLLSYADPSVEVDGFFGPATEEAVKAVQAGWGVPRTGVMDRELYERTDAYYFHDDPLPELDPALTERQVIPASSPDFPCEYFEVTEGPLFPCSSGQLVAELQSALASMGYSIDVDGQYGPGTMTAVQSVQESMGMYDTGIADTVFHEVLAQLTTTANGI